MRGKYVAGSLAWDPMLVAAPAETTEAVAAYLQSLAGDPHFAVRAIDSLYRVYGIADEDLDDAVLFLAGRVGAPPPTTEAVSGSPVETVADLVLMVSRLQDTSG